MTQDEIIEMARQVGMVYREFEDEFANANTDGVDLKTMTAFAKLVVAKAFENGFYAGFEASGEGWNGEWPFSDTGIDIRKDESIQYALKEARGEA